MTCKNKLGDLECKNPDQHTGGPDNRGCIFISGSMAETHTHLEEVDDKH